MAELSILIPTRNDAATLPEAVAALDRVIAQAATFTEVLVIDDCSEDETLTVAAELARTYPNLHMRVFRHQGRSFGGLVRYGLSHAVGRYCAIVSGDGTDPVDLLPLMLKHLRTGATLVLCSRYVRGGDAAKVGPSYRLYQSIYRTAIRLMVGTKVTDSTYGFRAFNRTYILSLGVSSNRFNVFPEMTLKVLLSGGSIEVLAGAPQPLGVGGSEKFKLPSELPGYAAVVARAALHRAGVHWF